MKKSKRRRETLETIYTRRYELALKPLAEALCAHINNCFKSQPRIDRITARAKAIESFLDKAKKQENHRPKYSEPIAQIQDQLGARVTTFFWSDVERLDDVVKRYFTPIEFKNHVPESEWEFGYFGRHYVLILPSDVIAANMERALIPRFFELQIKTLFQHAWSEANHGIGYKPDLLPALSSRDKRRLAYTSAQAWGAHQTFDEIFREAAVSVIDRAIPSITKPRVSSATDIEVTFDAVKAKKSACSITETLIEPRRCFSTHSTGRIFRFRAGLSSMCSPLISFMTLCASMIFSAKALRAVVGHSRAIMFIFPNSRGHHLQTLKA